MNSRVSLFATMLLIAPPAFADVTAEDIWLNWQVYANSFGMNIRGNETAGSNDLTIEDAEITGDFMEGNATFEINLGTLRFEETGDGDVLIVLPPELQAVSRVDAGIGGVQNSEATYTHAGLSIVVTGEPDDLQYDYTAAEISGTTERSTISQEQLVGMQTSNFTLANLSGQSTEKLGEAREVDGEFTAASINYTSRFEDKVIGTVADVTGSARDITLTSENTIPLQISEDFDPNQQLAAGLSAQGQIKVGANRTEISSKGDEPIDMRLSADGASVAFDLTKEGLTYDVAQVNTSAQIAGDFMPASVAFSIADSAFSVGFPVVESDQAEDIALLVTLDGITLSETLWSVFDPQAALPRDPARVMLDLTGKARLLFDMLDAPDATEMMAQNFSPAELESLQINGMEVAAMGASLTGEGAFTFSKAESGPGPALPRPEGAIDLTLTGANALLDKLVGAGLLPQEQAMGARMMMGMLGVPAATPDTLTSKIEVNEEFHIFANGQRIQ
ncbi:MAG: DUF2125 domain-containing protein [Pseudomonadota bacterium]